MYDKTNFFNNSHIQQENIKLINKLTQCGVIAVSRKHWYNRKAEWVALRALSKNINGKSYLHILHSNNYTIMIEFVQLSTYSLH